MPEFEPGPERDRLGFAVAASEEFGFLLELSFRQADLNVTFARYETDRRFVNVFHGRGSYELGVEIGRWVDVKGERREQRFPLRHVIVLERDPAEVGYGGTSATTAELVRRFVRSLAEWTREFASPLLTDGDDLFERLREANSAWYQSWQHETSAERLRARADEAWRQRDFGTVVSIYTEIDSQLPTVQLKASERGRLEYARKRLGATR